MTTLAPQTFRRVLFVALFSWTLLCVVTWRTPPGLHFYDPVMQLLAVQQAERGDSPAWNVLRRVDTADLSQDLLEPVGWWPPSIPALAGPLTGAGFSLGAALRAVVIVTGAAGALGWALWWTRFPLPPAWLFALAALVPWLRPASAGFFRFSGDNLAFAAAPWVFLALLGLSRRLLAGGVAWIPLGLSGLALGLSGAVKYSLAVTTVAAFFALAWMIWRRVVPAIPALARLAVLGLAILIVPVTLKVYHARQGAADPTGHSAPNNRTWSTAVFAVSNPVLGLADAASPAYLALTRFRVFAENSISWNLACTGLPGAVLLLWLLARAMPLHRRPPAEALALLALPVFTLLMVVLWLTSDAARDTRLFLPVTCAALPAVIVLGLEARSGARPAVRAFLLGGAFIYLVLPLAYGPAFVAAKVAEARHVSPAAPGIQLPSLGLDEQDALLAELAGFAAPDALWIVNDPEIALALPGRVLTERSGRSIAEDMAAVYAAPQTLAHWRSSALLQLRVLADPGESPPARPASIPGASAWSPHPVGGARKTLWTARLEPSIDASRVPPPPFSRP